ncbi:MAG: hypothetical protein WD646_13180 [Actinomycetota bacterium]
MVWDCFFFGDEVEMLEFRVRELAPVVDRFVVVEGDRTYSGIEKPSVFNQHRARFAEFEDKIDHVVVPLSVDGVDRYDRENEQHRALLPVIENLDPRDVVLLGDVDEIPYRGVVERLRDDIDVPLRLEMAWGVYYANWILPRRFLEGPFAFRSKDVWHRGVQSFLGDPMPYERDYHEHVLPAAGRHLSCLGGVESLSRKFASYIDPGFDNSRDRSVEHLAKCYEYGVHYEGRWLIDRIRDEQLDPMLRRLFEFKPEWFDFTQTRPAWRSRAYRAYTWLRRMGWLPERTLDFFERHPRAVTGTGAPIFAAVDACLELRRTIVKPVEHWKSWEYVGVNGRPLLGNELSSTQ